MTGGEPDYISPPCVVSRLKVAPRIFGEVLRHSDRVCSARRRQSNFIRGRETRGGNNGPQTDGKTNWERAGGKYA